jgi:hypothetical protein
VESFGHFNVLVKFNVVNIIVSTFVLADEESE